MDTKSVPAELDEWAENQRDVTVELYYYCTMSNVRHGALDSVDRVGYGAPPTMVADGAPPEQPRLNIVEAEDSEDQPENQWSIGRRMGVRVEAGPTTDSFPHFHCKMS